MRLISAVSAAAFVILAALISASFTTQRLMKTIVEINGKRYEWRVNRNIAKWSCLMCAGFRDSSVCCNSGCSDMPAHRYLVELAQPKSAQNTPSEARRKAGGK